MVKNSIFHSQLLQTITWELKNSKSHTSAPYQHQMADGLATSTAAMVPRPCPYAILPAWKMCCITYCVWQLRGTTWICPQNSTDAYQKKLLQTPHLRHNLYVSQVAAKNTHKFFTPLNFSGHWAFSGRTMLSNPATFDCIFNLFLFGRDVTSSAGSCLCHGTLVPYQGCISTGTRMTELAGNSAYPEYGRPGWGLFGNNFRTNWLSQWVTHTSQKRIFYFVLGDKQSEVPSWSKKLKSVRSPSYFT